MDKRKIRLVVPIFVALLMISIGGIIFSYPRQVHNWYLSVKYDDAINDLGEALYIFAEGDEDQIKRVSTRGAPYLRPSVLPRLPIELRGIDINSMSVKTVIRSKENGTSILLMDMNFGKDSDVLMRVKLEKSSNRWLVGSLFFPNRM